jgi:hypothetical protein
MLPPELAQKIDDLMRADLVYWRDLWFGQLLLATKVVVGGLILEGPELMCELTSIVRKRNQWGRLELPEVHIPDWVKLVAFLGWILIVLGVAGEWITNASFSDADNNLQTFTSINLAEAQKEAAFAIERASSNEKEAGQLRKDAEAEHLARVKLQKQIQPRTINESDRKKLAETLRPFAPNFKGRKVKISSQTGDAEGMLFSLEIMDVLTSAGIDVDADGMGALISVHAVAMGVIIKGPPIDRDFIRSLVGGLNAKLGTDLGTSVYGEWKPEYSELGIMVGVKPIPGLPQNWLHK